MRVILPHPPFGAGGRPGWQLDSSGLPGGSVTVGVRRLLLVPVLALTVLAACGGGGGGSAGGGAEVVDGEVVIEDFTFQPREITVPTGTTVTWTNTDTFAHSIQPDDELFPTSPDIETGESFSHAYEDPGTYPYICGIHNSMTGTVVVS